LRSGDSVERLYLLRTVFSSWSRSFRSTPLPHNSPTSPPHVSLPPRTVHPAHRRRSRPKSSTSVSICRSHRRRTNKSSPPSNDRCQAPPSNDTSQAPPSTTAPTHGTCACLPPLLVFLQLQNTRFATLFSSCSLLSTRRHIAAAHPVMPPSAALISPCGVAACPPLPRGHRSVLPLPLATPPPIAPRRCGGLRPR
jgi:hypothetical protein